MSANEQTILALRTALSVSPDNLPLRRHLAATLLAAGQPEEGLKEYKDCLSLSPKDGEVKLGIANCYFALGNFSAASVVVEELRKSGACEAGVKLLQARLAARGGDYERAARDYQSAVDADPNLADERLARDLEAHREHAAESREEFDAPAPESPDSAPSGPLRMGVDLERPTIDFGDVGGMETLKEEIRLKIIHPLANAEIYKAYGKAIGGGMLLYGPPGCGKTYLARATAGEVKAAFLAIGINDVLDMWLGNSEKNLHELFQTARRNKPCVMFIDEVDALGASRTDLLHSAGRLIINQFLSELDGVKSANDGVLILAATNAPWHLDNAFRRPGRFDRILFVPPPDAPARACIFQLVLQGKPIGKIDYNRLAKSTDSYSGADIKSVVDHAVEGKLRQALRKGIPEPISTDDLLQAIRAVKPSTLEWFATARNYATYANQAGIYDDILHYLNRLK